MFSLQNVSKSFGDLQVVKPTTIIFNEGQSTVLIGPSGCGKSTLLRLLIGLIVPDTGTIEFGGEKLTPSNILAQRQRMGYVIQDGGLFPHLTAQENVGLLAKHLRWDRSKIDKRVRELADLTRLPHTALNRYPLQMSGGQRQRVGIMGALDPLVRFDLQEDLRNIFRSLRKTSIMVTHDMGEAGFFGDRVLLLSEGSIVQEGHLQDLIDRPANEYVTKFINAQRIPQT